MPSPHRFANLDDLVARYLGGVSLQQLAEQAGSTRYLLGRALTAAGVTLRDQSAAERARWKAIKATPGGVERQLGAAWVAADARNAPMERKALSLYRGGLISQAQIAKRLGISKPTVGNMLRRNDIVLDQKSLRRATGNAGGFNPAMQTDLEPAFADELTARGLDYIHQCAIGTRNVDFGFAQARVAVEIVRRHRCNAKSLGRERLEQLFGAGWRLFVIYDPDKRGVQIARAADQLVAFLDFMRANPPAGGQYGMVGGDGEVVPARRGQLHHFARVPGF